MAEKLPQVGAADDADLERALADLRTHLVYRPLGGFTAAVLRRIAGTATRAPRAFVAQEGRTTGRMQPMAVVGVFMTSHDAERALDALRRAGFRPDQLGFAMRETVPDIRSEVEA
jgi:hypothetical protein